MTNDWSIVTDNLDVLAEGLLRTLQISVLSLLLSIPFGILIGLMRVSKWKILSYIATAYVEFIRGVPLMVLLIWIYFVLGSSINISSFWSAVWGLVIFSAAFIAEIVRSGVQAVPKGQVEAARSSGMNYVQSMRFIVLPQAFRTVTPALASQFIILIKDSSLVSTISVVELTLVGRNLVATSFRSMEVWTFIALLYFIVTFSLSLLVRLLEKKFSQGQ